MHLSPYILMMVIMMLVRMVVVVMAAAVIVVIGMQFSSSLPGMHKALGSNKMRLLMAIIKPSKLTRH